MNLEVRAQDVYGPAAAFEADDVKEQLALDSQSAKAHLMVAQQQRKEDVA